MKHKHHFFAILSIVLLCACSQEEHEWQTFTSEQGNFSVSVPDVMQERIHNTDTPLGQVESHVFTLHRGAYGYAIAYTDYPVAGIAGATPRGVLDEGVSRTLESFSATLVTTQDILLDDSPGIEFRGEFLGGEDLKTAAIIYGRVYLFRARLYQLTTVA